MIRGIFALVSVEGRADAWKGIMKELSSERIKWVVDCLDCWGDGKLTSRTYEPQELLSCLEGDNQILFARMMAIPTGEDLSREIEHYEDYVQSNCQSVVICTDASYFEIYSKDLNLLTKLSELDVVKNAERFEWTDDLNDGRTEFTF